MSVYQSNQSKRISSPRLAFHPSNLILYFSLDSLVAQESPAADIPDPSSFPSEPGSNPCRSVGMLLRPYTMVYKNGFDFMSKRVSLSTS